MNDMPKYVVSSTLKKATFVGFETDPGQSAR